MDMGTVGTDTTYRAMFAVDIERSAARGDSPMLNNRDVLRDTLRAALTDAGIDWDRCHRTDLGDGFRIVVPAEVPKARLIQPTVTSLAARLRAHNRAAGLLGTIRVRAALHAGDVHMDDGMVVGGSLETLARLLDAAPLRQVLAAVPGTATVALAVSEHIHEEVLRHGYPGIDPDTYRPFSYRVKEASGTAWIHVPGHSVDEIRLSPADDEPRRKKRPRSGPTYMNVAKRGSRVREQIGSIGTRIDHVTTTAGADSSADAGTVGLLLEELRRSLAEEWAAGHLDRETFEAASDELGTAAEQAAVPDRGQVLLALRRLKGLVEDLAGLTAKVAATITAVSGVKGR